MLQSGPGSRVVRVEVFSALERWGLDQEAG